MKSFNWTEARPYSADADGPAAAAAAAAAARPLTAAAAAAARAARHRVPGTDAAARCDGCAGDVVGPRFECVHCPGRFAVCAACELALATAHPPGHVFLVDLGSPDPGPDPDPAPAPAHPAPAAGDPLNPLLHLFRAHGGRGGDGPLGDSDADSDTDQPVRGQQCGQQ